MKCERWENHTGSTDDTLFLVGHCVARVCPVYLKEWKLSFFLGFLQAWWGSTAVSSCRGLWEHFLLSNRSILPTCIVSPWVLPSQLYKHSTRWNHCFPPLVRYKRTYLPFICRHQYPLAESILMPDHVAQLPLNIYICSYCHFIPQITWRYKCS